MLGQLCPNVYDAEPTLAQQWVNVSCLRVDMMGAEQVTPGETTSMNSLIRHLANPPFCGALCKPRCTSFYRDNMDKQVIPPKLAKVINLIIHLNLLY